MDNTDFTRYSRQIFMEEIGVEGQRKLASAKVLIVGAGGLGSPVIQYLLAAGVGTLAVADHDTVEWHNLNRQIIHTEATVGRPKVESAHLFAQRFNSKVEFVPIPDKMTHENLRSIMPMYDIVVDASDNFTTRYLINDVCVALGKPLVYGSILGFEGQVAVFNLRGSKHLRDLFPEIPKTTMDCDKNGVLGALPGVVGSLMAMNVLKIITDLKVSTNELLIINLLDWRFMSIEF